MTRTCGKCELEKPLEAFYANRPGTQCRDCIQSVNQKWYKTNKGRRRATADRWRRENPERWAELRKRHRSTPEAKARALLGDYVRRYGLTVEEAVHWLTNKPEVCPLCGHSASRLVLDHCHATGRVRGWLCHTCNIGIGAFRDDPSLMSRAIAYLAVKP